MKRRISRRQFIQWTQFDGIKPIDGSQRIEHALASLSLLTARIGGDKQSQLEDFLLYRFEPESEADSTPGLDPAILKAFAASG